MSSKKLMIVSGDSFTTSRYMSMHYPKVNTNWTVWPELVADKLGMTCINLAKSGFGNEYIYSSLLDEIVKHPIEDIDGINFLQRDIFENKTIEEINYFFGEKIDVLLSDMAPNTIGHAKADHLRIINLVEVAIDLSNKVLKKEGIFICKIFQGGAQGELQKKMKKNFYNLKYFKPKSSRPESSEAYLIAKKI